MRLDRRRALGLLAAAAVPVPCCGVAYAALPSYGLQARALGDGLHVFRGHDEYFSRENGGNILNTAFLETAEGVVVFDTGPSRIYGEEMRAAIAAVTDAPVLTALVTHGHPDHFCGSEGFADVPVAALDRVKAFIAREGDALTENMYRLVDRYMFGTATLPPNAVLAPGPQRLGGRAVELLDLGGHTDQDLALFDVASGTLFAGDLVFYDRAPTTPHAHIPTWIDALDRLAELPIRRLVPGHGPITEGTVAIAQTRDYLVWLHETLVGAAERGLAMTEVMALEIPERFRRMAVLEEEFVRSIAHLYPAIELRAMPRVD